MRYVKRRERERERNGGRDLCALYNTDYVQNFMLRVIFFHMMSKYAHTY